MKGIEKHRNDHIHHILGEYHPLEKERNVLDKLETCRAEKHKCRTYYRLDIGFDALFRQNEDRGKHTAHAQKREQHVVEQSQRLGESDRPVTDPQKYKCGKHRQGGNAQSYISDDRRADGTFCQALLGKAENISRTDKERRGSEKSREVEKHLSTHVCEHVQSASVKLNVYRH